MLIKSYRISVKEAELAEEKASSLGFLKGKGNPNLSELIRWLFQFGYYPVNRDSYDDLIKSNHNLIKLGGLFNQYVFHLNRELKILNEKDISENNKGFLNDIKNQRNEFLELRQELKEMKEILESIIKKETVL